MSEGCAELLGRPLLAFADFTAVDHHIALMSGRVNADRAE
jgi:hypothetical protein